MGTSFTAGFGDTMFRHHPYLSSFQDSEGLWSESVHVGEVGGNNLGLYGGFPTSDSSLIVSHGFQVGGSLMIDLLLNWW